MTWEAVALAAGSAKSIAFDGCHKIYVLMDDEQTQLMTGYGYRENGTSGASRLYTSAEMTPEQMLAQLHEWYDESCGLRFINAVRTVRGDENKGFTALIAQGEDDEEEA